MSGHKSQRTKGNVKPSSSSRAAEFLHQSGQTSFIGFSALANNSYGYVPQPKAGDDNDLDSDLRMLLRKMTKKDTVTRLKAIQEFTLLCKEKDQNVIHDVLSFWPRIYNKISLDFDHRVREAAQQAHHQITTKAGRKLAPYLKQIIMNWLMAQYDTYTPAASAARASFNEVFQEKKKSEVLLHCKTEILEALQHQLMKETADTLSDPKVIPIEEREAKYARFISSSFMVLKFYLDSLPTDDKVDNSVEEMIKALCDDKKFWKFTKHTSSLIRNSYFQVMTTFCSVIPNIVYMYQKQYCVAVLTTLDEAEPIVVKSLWDAVLITLTKIEGCWDHVSARKAVLPKLWKLLKSFCYGNPSVVYPNLLPFLSTVPQEVLGEGIGFYEEFFGSLLEGLHLKQEILTVTDGTLMTKAYMECIQYLIFKPNQDSIVIEYLIGKQLYSLLDETFNTDGQRYLWYGICFNEFNNMLKYINKNTEKHLATQLWKIIYNVIFVDEPTEKTIFKGDSENFFGSLVDFIFSLHNQDSSLLVLDSIEAAQSNFILKLMSCFLDEIFEKKNYSVVLYFMKILMLIQSKEIMKFVTSLKKIENEEENILEVLKIFVQEICQPLLVNEKVGGEERQVISKLMVSLITYVEDSDKEIYLKFLLKDMNFGEEIVLNLLTETFQLGCNNSVEEFLKSSHLQKLLLDVCTVDVCTVGSRDERMFSVKWDILQAYIELIKDNQPSFIDYSNQLLKMMITSLTASNETSNMNIFKCFANLTKVTQTFTDEFYDVFKSLLLFATTTSKDELQKQPIDYVIECVTAITADTLNHQTFIKVFSDWMSIAASNSTKQDSFLHLLSTLDDIFSNNNLDKDILAKNLLRGERLETVKGDSKTNMVLFYFQIMQKLQVSSNNILNDDMEIIARIFHSCVKVTLLSTKFPFGELIGEIMKKMSADLQLKVMQESIQSSNSTGDTSVISYMFGILNQCNLLSDDLSENCMTISSPKEYCDLSKVDTYCIVVSSLTDVSNVRALMEKYVDEMEENQLIKDNPQEFCGFIKIFLTTLQQWYKLFNQSNIDSSTDYQLITQVFLDNLLIWKEANSECMLFACSLNGIENWRLHLNMNIMKVFGYILKNNAKYLTTDHWDFLMCSLISWLQTCDESKELRASNKLTWTFFSQTLHLFYDIGYMFESHIAKVYFESNELSPLPSLSIHVSNEAEGDIAGVETIGVVTEDLSTEWKEFFSPAACKCVLSIFMNDISKVSKAEEAHTKMLCKCIEILPLDRLCEFIYEGITDVNKQEKVLETFFTNLTQHLSRKQWYYKLTTYQLLYKLCGLIENKFCHVFKENEDEEQEEMRSFPSSLVEVMEASRNECISYLTECDASIDSPLFDMRTAPQHTSLFTYMLSWLLILNIFKCATPNNRAKFANLFYKRNYANELVSCLFCLVPEVWDEQRKVHFELCDWGAIQETSCLVLTKVLECIPALVRSWFNNSINRRDAASVEKFISSYISPSLLKKEFIKLDNSSKEFSNMIIKTRPVAREIVSVYTVDEISMELQVKLPANYPLTPVTVECGKRIGVSNALWRQWMLQLTSFLTFQNGNILEGLALWKKNVDKRFEGVEECMVCFSIIHPSNYSLPSIACKTCKKKYHPVCLYKWFNTSGKSTCPLCRNIF